MRRLRPYWLRPTWHTTLPTDSERFTWGLSLPPSVNDTSTVAGKLHGCSRILGELVEESDGRIAQKHVGRDIRGVGQPVRHGQSATHDYRVLCRIVRVPAARENGRARRRPDPVDPQEPADGAAGGAQRNAPRYGVADYNLARGLLFRALYKPAAQMLALVAALAAAGRGGGVPLHELSDEGALRHHGCRRGRRRRCARGGPACDEEALRQNGRDLGRAFHLRGLEDLRRGEVPRSMSKGFTDAVVLTQNNPGHCSLAAPSLCTAKYIRPYFREGTHPPPGTVCEVDGDLFPPVEREEDDVPSSRRRIGGFVVLQESCLRRSRQSALSRKRHGDAESAKAQQWGPEEQLTSFPRVAPSVHSRRALGAGIEGK
ncbi:hypothetical protein AURDEDRAFT_131212 [Auricularia subglabra TFB-10046 SS5]|uniref:Peptidase S33 tripeptidyl aminopeptidase-like C-terminal domain-containing protein n=1 Tax=Auricularia subglabra (strain TFB-10046 / SS5) TaxID=717982 RepID=J0LCV6_AURST|nr:hypothetical protein AURDEDRAFT_131212 [Auricularia subglabra TFB-10046 SS5]